jgi:hypothetical protein
MATVLTLHPRTADPDLQAEKTREAASALKALAELMPATDPLRQACDLLAVALASRVHFSGGA